MNTQRILLSGTFLLAAALTVLLRSGADSDVRSKCSKLQTHFKMPGIIPQEWEVRRQELRQQILSAAGLLPMPAKTPCGRKSSDGWHTKLPIEVILSKLCPDTSWSKSVAGRQETAAPPSACPRALEAGAA